MCWRGYLMAGAYIGPPRGVNATCGSGTRYVSRGSVIT
jgi:hypothetical protein